MTDPNLNPYAAPTASLVPEHLGNEGVWRDFNLLVVRQGSILPDRCVKCNAPTEGSRKQLTLYWHSPWLFLLVLINLILYVVVNMIVRQKIELSTGVCRRHLARRRWGILFAWLLFLGGVGVSILGGSMMDDRRQQDLGLPVLLAGCAMMLGAAVYGVVGCRLLWPKRIDPYFAWIKGACPEYLAELPELPPPSGPLGYR